MQYYAPNVQAGVSTGYQQRPNYYYSNQQQQPQQPQGYPYTPYTTPQYPTVPFPQQKQNSGGYNDYYNNNGGGGAARGEREAPPAPPTLKLQRSRTATTAGMRAVGSQPGPGILRTPSVSFVGDHDGTFRQRVNSDTKSYPDHLFLSFEGSNVLRVTNLVAASPALEVLRKAILPLWPEGVVSDTHKRYKWVVTFAGSPWTATDKEGILARRLITQLFAVLASQGYNYLTTVHTGHPLNAPRLIFTPTTPDHSTHYFAISLSPSGRSVTLIDAPSKIPGQNTNLIEDVNRAVRHALGNERKRHRPPGAYQYSDWQTDCQKIVETKQGPGIVNIDASALGNVSLNSSGSGTNADSGAFYLGHIVKAVSSHGYRLEASVPMGRSGFLGLMGRKELWVFRRVAMPSPSGHGAPLARTRSGA